MKKLLYILGTLGLSFMFVWSASYSATSYDVYTIPEMYLNEGISSTQTTGITIAAPKLNGSEITLNTMTGAILEFRRPGKKEDIYTSLLIVNADNTLTLSGTVIRDVCQYTELRTFTTCGNGITFQRGNVIRLTDNHRLFNLKADIDRVNTFTGSGQITSNQTSQAWIDANCVTTAQRDAFTFVNEGNIVCNSSTSTIDVYTGGQWTALASGTGALQNATELVTGKVLLSGTGTIVTASGSTSPPNVLWTKYTTQTGGTTSNYGYIPHLNINGFLNPSLGGTGSGSLTQSGVLVGNGTNPLSSIAPGANGNVLTSNGDEWTSGTVGEGKVIRLMAKDFTPSASNGSSAIDIGANGQITLRFDTTTSENAEANFILPSDYTDGSTITTQIWWYAFGGSSSQTVEFEVSATALRNDDPVSTAYGTAIANTDTWIATGDVHVMSVSSAITIGNSATSGDLVKLKVTRDVANDDLSADAGLIGMTITYQ